MREDGQKWVAAAGQASVCTAHMCLAHACTLTQRHSVQRRKGPLDQQASCPGSSPHAAPLHGTPPLQEAGHSRAQRAPSTLQDCRTHPQNPGKRSGLGRDSGCLCIHVNTGVGLCMPCSVAWGQRCAHEGQFWPAMVEACSIRAHISLMTGAHDLKSVPFSCHPAARRAYHANRPGGCALQAEAEQGAQNKHFHAGRGLFQCPSLREAARMHLCTWPREPGFLQPGKVQFISPVGHAP
jgi:hypothetical protein